MPNDHIQRCSISFISHQQNTNQNYNEIQLHTYQGGYHQTDNSKCCQRYGEIRNLDIVGRNKKRVVILENSLKIFQNFKLGVTIRSRNSIRYMPERNGKLRRNENLSPHKTCASMFIYLFFITSFQNRNRNTPNVNLVMNEINKMSISIQWNDITIQKE